MSIALRHLGPGDAELARCALARLKVTETAQVEPPPPASVRSFLEKPENVFLAAIDGDDPVGFALAYLLDRCDRARPMMLFYEIGVAESHRRRGVGRALVERLKAECARHDVFKMWVLTNRSNRAAVALFEATGATAAGGGDELSFRYDF